MTPESNRPHRFCGSCGLPLASSAKAFCTRCGKPLEDLDHVAHGSNPAVDGGTAPGALQAPTRLQGITEVRAWLRKGLREALEKHPRIERDRLKERDYQAITCEVIAGKLAPCYRILLDRRIAVRAKDWFTDLMIVHNEDQRCGQIAIEVKPPGAARRELLKDVRKLKKYTDSLVSNVTITHGILIYFRSTDTHDEAVRRAVRDLRKVSAFRVSIPRRREVAGG